MSPLMIRIATGHEDARLMVHIETLERIKKQQDGGNGLSPGEQQTLLWAYDRLDLITAKQVPNGS